MRELSQHSSTTPGNSRTPRQDERRAVQPARAAPGWRRAASDSLLAIAGVALVTSLIATVHLYPRLPSIVLIYLLLIIALASTRGRYAALLAAVLASLSFDFFLTPPLYQFTLTNLEADDLLDPWVLLAAAVIAGQVIAVLRRRTEQARRSEQEVRLLSQQAQDLAAVQERQRLARELHDSVSQALYGISLGAYTAREALETDPAEAIAPLEYVLALSEAGLAEMQALLFELRPESLASEGLVAALNKQETVLRTRYKLLVEAHLGEEPHLSLEGKQALYRTAQEALHNIIKHAHARTVILRLSRQEGDLLLEIGDDGKGFEPTGPFPGHFGLLSMQERAAELGGTCSIESAPAQGTHLRVCVPLHDELGSAGEKESSPDPTSVSRSEHSLFSVFSASRRGC